MAGLVTDVDAAGTEEAAAAAAPGRAVRMCKRIEPFECISESHPLQRAMLQLGQVTTGGSDSQRSQIGDRVLIANAKSPHKAVLGWKLEK
jgi:hypothetical protein